jgi:hypothetical protein
MDSNWFTVFVQVLTSLTIRWSAFRSVRWLHQVDRHLHVYAFRKVFWSLGKPEWFPLPWSSSGCQTHFAVGTTISRFFWWTSALLKETGSLNVCSICHGRGSWPVQFMVVLLLCDWYYQSHKGTSARARQAWNKRRCTWQDHGASTQDIQAEFLQRISSLHWLWDHTHWIGPTLHWGVSNVGWNFLLI